VRVDRTAGLKQNRFAEIGEPGHEGIDLGLEQWLAAGDLNKLIAELQCPVQNLIETEGFPLREGMRRITVNAAEVARRQTNEDTRHARKRALALQAAIDLVDEKRTGGFPFERLQAMGSSASRSIRFTL
jgi:hypothetical protein